MAVFNSSVLTTRGSELLVDAVAGDQITFTRMVVGCGVYSDGERERNLLEKRTALKDARQEFTFSAYKKVSEQCVLLTAVISNRELDYSYKITEIGIYGKRSQDAEDFLCSLAVTKSLEESDTFPPYNGLQECQIVQDYYITISPDAEVSVITQGACVLREEFEALRESKLDKDGDGSDLTVDFKQASERRNITPKTKLSLMMGVISKVIEDLKTGAFSFVVNNLFATEEGGVLDARQGKVLDEKIEAVKRMVDTVKQSFMDGCRKIVDKLTALGYTPDSPQGPDQINAKIQFIYDDRYNKGFNAGEISGINKVKANPEDYGIEMDPNVEVAYMGDISSTDRANRWPEDYDNRLITYHDEKPYTIQHTGKAILVMHMTAVQQYDCEENVSVPHFKVKLDGNEILFREAWREYAAQEWDAWNVTAVWKGDVTEGQVLTQEYDRGYLTTVQFGGTLTVLY